MITGVTRSNGRWVNTPTSIPPRWLFVGDPKKGYSRINRRSTCRTPFRKESRPVGAPACVSRSSLRLIPIRRQTCGIRKPPAARRGEAGRVRQLCRYFGGVEFFFPRVFSFGFSVCFLFVLVVSPLVWKGVS